MYTPTNDQALIDYLKAHKLENLSITKDFESFSIINLTIEDQPLIKQWVFEEEIVEDDLVSLYLSHGFYESRSYVFNRSYKKTIGIFAFNIFNHAFSKNKLCFQKNSCNYKGR